MGEQWELILKDERYNLVFRSRDNPSPNYDDNYGNVLLKIAIKGNHINIVRILAKSFINFEDDNFIQCSIDNGNFVALEIILESNLYSIDQLIKAFQSEIKSVPRASIKCSKLLVDKLNNPGDLLKIQCRNMEERMLTMLLLTGKFDNQVFLDEAINLSISLNFNYRTIKLILSRGIDVVNDFNAHLLLNQTFERNNLESARIIFEEMKEKSMVSDKTLEKIALKLKI